MKRILVLLGAAILSGCGVWGSTIRSDLLDYSSAIDETSDKYLLINILEARDNAPVHFVEMPKINGALQGTASLTGSAAFLPRAIGTTGEGIVNDTTGPTVSVQSSPTFEVDNLDTKEFATGNTSPIDPNQIKYWFDRGLDHRILLYLFFSSMQVQFQECVAPDDDKNPRPEQKAEYDECKAAYGMPARECESPGAESYKACEQAYSLGYSSALKNCAEVASLAGSKPAAKKKALEDCLTTRVNVEQVIDARNDPRESANALLACGSSGVRCKSLTPFESYFKLVNRIQQRFLAHAYGERALVAKEVYIAPKDVAKFDPAKYDLEYLSDIKEKKKLDRYNIYSVSADKNIAFCFADKPLTKNAGDDSSNACAQSTITDQAKSTPDAPPTVERILRDDPATICKKDTIVDRHSYCAIYLGYLAYLDALKSNGPRDQDEIRYGSRHYSLALSIRSTGEIVRFLGDLLYYQDNVPGDATHNARFTIDYDDICHDAHRGDPGECIVEDGGYLFTVNLPDGENRFAVDYRNGSYALGMTSPANHSLEVLSALNLSINLNKSATDIRATPVIQVVP